MKAITPGTLWRPIPLSLINLSLASWENQRNVGPGGSVTSFSGDQAIHLDMSVYIANIVYMKDIVHARLDTHTREIMRRLQRRHGWSESEIVRIGIRALADTDLLAGEQARKIYGLGEFASGIDDLGSNDKHLEDFGR